MTQTKKGFPQQRIRRIMGGDQADNSRLLARPLGYACFTAWYGNCAVFRYSFGTENDSPDCHSEYSDVYILRYLLYGNISRKPNRIYGA